MSNDTSRLNLYIGQQLADNLDALSEQINVPKNSLVNFAIAKLLIEMKVVDDFNDSKAKETQTVLKETDYCKLLKQGRIETPEQISTIERIHVKEQNREEIRFAYYKKNKNDNDRLVLRPLDLEENELFQLFIAAISEDVFSNDFTQKLKKIL